MMNEDEFKDALGQNRSAGVGPSVRKADLTEMNAAVNRLLKNMRYEFLCIIAVFVLLTYFTFELFGSHDPEISFLSNVLDILFFILITTTGFYYSRFYNFYRSINGYDLNVKDSIQKFVHALELNIEAYKTYIFCITPLCVFIGIELKGGASGIDYIRRFLASDFFVSPWHLLLSFLTILFSLIITYLVNNWYVNTCYGKELALIKKIVDKLPLDYETQ